MLPLWCLTALRRKLFESFGSTRYSKPSYNNIENQLQEFLPKKGFYIEAGAVDGVFESNTYFLDEILGWHGILIEPMPDMFKRLSFNRKNAYKFNCAIVANESENMVLMENKHAMSAIETRSNDAGRKNEMLQVRGRTITSILDEVKPDHIDFFSLDVEGYELEVLKGLNFEKYKPKYLLIECLDDTKFAKVDQYISDKYILTDKLSYRDFLFKLKDSE
nr:FkbM family methyltransferase [uncultured Desulfobacter sp.]